MIKVIGRNSYQRDIEGSKTVAEAMQMLGLRQESHICLRNGVPITSRDIISPDDDVTFMEIFSGGY